MTSFRKPITNVRTVYACIDCSTTLTALPYEMEQRRFCSACGCSMFKVKGLAAKEHGPASDKAIDSTFHRPMTGKHRNR